MVQEDSVQIPSQKIRILCFRLDNVVFLSGRSSVSNIHPNNVAIPSKLPSMSRTFEQHKLAYVWTSWQHVRMLFRVREDFSILVYPSEQRGYSIQMPVRAQGELGFPLQTQICEDSCIRPDVKSTPFGRYP